METPAELARRSTIRTIERLAACGNLLPVNVIAYRRQAWMGAVDHRLRLTFDTLVEGRRPAALFDVRTGHGQPLIPPNHCVMELKFNRVVALQRVRVQRFSKYATGVDALHGTVRPAVGRTCDHRTASVLS